MPKLDAAIQEKLDAARAEILLLREHSGVAIFGKSQKLGIRVTTNGFFAPSQFELALRPVCSVILSGEAGTGKTAFAGFIFCKFRKLDKHGIWIIPVTKITGMGDMTPSQLIGHKEYLEITEADGRKAVTEILRQGYIVLDRNFLILDEVLRTNQELFNALRHILTEGKIVHGESVYEIAPPDEPFIVISTANPPGSSGTRTPGQFFVDGITACSIFRTEYENDDYVLSLISPQEHWENIRNRGLDRAIMDPRRLAEIQQLFFRHTKTPDREKRYMMRLLRAFIALTRSNWRDSECFRGKPLPERWQDMKRFPTKALIKEPGGRKAQHLEVMSRADSFFTYGKTETIIPAIQAMAKAVFAFAIMCRPADGGLDILDGVYSEGDEAILAFTRDLLDYWVRCVDVPRAS